MPHVVTGPSPLAALEPERFLGLRMSVALHRMASAPLCGWRGGTIS
jgi:hypothetical protein